MKAGTVAAARQKPRVLFLERASAQGLCFCKCKVSHPDPFSQLDCPWCGCGWLWSCATCGKAYTFAKAVETDRSFEEIAQRALKTRGLKFSQRDVGAMAKELAQCAKELQVGEEYVYLDGLFINTKQGKVIGDGLFGRHKLRCVPQVAGLKRPDLLQSLLASPEYWYSVQHPEDR